ncbi:MAG: hypothetical protein ACYC4L_18720 [Chloroflexota bacterium]
MVVAAVVALAAGVVAARGVAVRVGALAAGFVVAAFVAVFATGWPGNASHPAISSANTSASNVHLLTTATTS